MKTEIFLPIALLAAAEASVTLRGQTEEAALPEVSAELVEVSAKEMPVTKHPEASEFAAKLTVEEKASAGLEKLSPEQLAALNALVAKEVKLARQGDVGGFAGTFVSRRTEEEQAAAGVGILTTSEKYHLDRLVSRALATKPAQPPIVIARPATEADLASMPFKWETHGFVQLEYGWGSGGSEYKAGTVAVTQVNPKTGTAFSFAYTAAEGDGAWYCRDYSSGWRSRPYARGNY